MKKEKEIPTIERQLLLYDRVCRFPIASFDLIKEEIPYHNTRLIQRDLKVLEDAGLVRVEYSRKAKGYIKKNDVPERSREGTKRRLAHLEKLSRLGTLMRELTNEDIPIWEKKEQEMDGTCPECLTARDSYRQLFPGLSERTRQRDFALLRRIGYDISYDRYEQRYVQDNSFAFAWVEAPDVIDEDYLDGIW